MDLKYKRSVLSIIAAAVIALAACKQHKKQMAANDVFYTCSMHPQVMEPGPGKCPICGMDLIPVQKSKAPKADEIELSEQQMQLGNIRVDTIGKAAMGSQTVLTATLTYDQQKLTAISAKLTGRIERLYYKNMGDYVKKGAPLMDVYSEELNNAKQEYLLALERKKQLDNSLINFDLVISSAKTKLLLWGMNESQVNTLGNSNKNSLITTIYSSESGYITALNTQEGAYVSEGSTIMQLADLSTLWAEAQVYTSLFSQLNTNSSVTVKMPDTGKEIKGKIEFVNPEINPDKRINLIRVALANQDGQLKPGMPACVVLNSSRQNTLSLPADAVIRNADGSSVWVQTGKNIFKNKMVTTGVEGADRIEITSGLTQGEAVVTSGAYLINSEYIFKRGSSPMAGMNY